MDANGTSTGGKFPRRLFGYSRREVDSHLDEGARAYQAACREIERLRAAEPLARVGGDVAALISSFADTVATMRDSAKREADDVRLEADAYAGATREGADAYALTTRETADAYAAAQRAEADRQHESATLRARAEAAAMVHTARAEIAGLIEQRQQIERSLREAADGVTNAIRAITRVGGLAEPDMPRGPAYPETPTVETTVRPVVPGQFGRPDGLAGAPGEPVRPVARSEMTTDLLVDSPGTSTVSHLTVQDAIAGSAGGAPTP